MKKQQTLAIAIGAALSALILPATAAETKAPEFYGMLYASLDYLPGDQWQLNSRNSRVGLKQDIQLQNGLTAVWRVEVGVEVDDGDRSGHQFTQRDIYAGLKGDFGQVIAGRFNTPLRNAEGKIDPFNHLRGDIDKVLGGQVRVNNIVQYSSPKFSNTQIHAAFMPAENKDFDGDGKNDTNLADSYSIAAVYDQNGLYASAALDINGEAKTVTDIGARSDRLQLAAKYQLGAASIGGIIQHARDSDDSDLKETAFTVSSTYKIDAYTLKAQYGLNKGSETKNKKDLLAVGVDYQLDKAAVVTLAYAITANDPNVGKRDETDEVTLAYQLKF